jgi:hypothetical protein
MLVELADAFVSRKGFRLVALKRWGEGATSTVHIRQCFTIGITKDPPFMVIFIRPRFLPDWMNNSDRDDIF